MTTHLSHRPADTVVAEAARRMSAATSRGTSRPLALGAWREVMATGRLAADDDPDATAAGLVRRWHQHLAVVIDLPMERWAPGEERLPALLTEWLDLARRTVPVREHVARTAGPRAEAELARQRALVAGLLSEDLAALGAPAPERSASDLVSQLEAVAAAEDAAGRVLRSARQTLVGGTGAARARAPRRPLRDRIAARLHLASA